MSEKMTPAELVGNIKSYIRNRDRESELRAEELLDEVLRRLTWVRTDDIPNIDAMSAFHRDLDKPMVTRLRDGSWWVHPPVGSPLPQSSPSISTKEK